MFLPEIMLWLTRGGWLMLLHLSARESFPKPLEPQEEQALVARMLDGDGEAWAATSRSLRGAGAGEGPSW